MRSKKLLKLVGAIVLAVVIAIPFAVGCAAPTPAPTEPTKTLNYGVVVALTGPGAEWGIGHLRAIHLWADDVNAAGGIRVGNERYRVEVIGGDTKSDPKVAIEIASKLIHEDGVGFVTVNPPCNEAIQPLLTENKVFSMVNRLPPLLKPEWPYAFSITPDGTDVSRATYIWLQEEHPGLTRVGNIVTDDIFGHGSYDLAVPVYEELGFENAAVQWMPVDVLDVYPFVSAILAKGVDVIDASGAYAEQGGLVVKVARELGFWGPILLTGVLPGLMAEIAGWEKAEGSVTAGGWQHTENWEDATEKELEVYNKYIKKYGSADKINSISYNDGWIFQQAIEKAQSLDPDKILEALHTYEFQTLHGTYRFTGKGRYGIDNQLPPPVWISVFTGGTLKTVGVVVTPLEYFE